MGSTVRDRSRTFFYFCYAGNSMGQQNENLLFLVAVLCHPVMRDTSATYRGVASSSTALP